MHKSILLGLLPALALATPAFRLRRDDELAAQDCSAVPDHKACGIACILESDTCCPDNSGGCPAGTYCSLGDNNQYGCCPEGVVCGGDGGVTTGTIDITSTSTSTSTLEITYTDEASSTVTEETTSTTSSEVVLVTDTSAREEPTATVSASSVEPSVEPSSAEAASSSSSATAYITSTIYTTTIHTITSCPATHPCTAGASTPVILVTETIAVSTTICPVVESPPLPTPTGSVTATGSAIPVPKPSVICPGGGKNCFSATSSAVVVPVPTKPATKSATGTGAYHVPSPTGKPVTAGAGKATFGLAAVVAAFAALL